MYSLQIQMTLPDKEATVNLHYQETDPVSTDATACTELAEGFIAVTAENVFRQWISNLAAITGVKVYRLSGDAVAPGYATDRMPGARSGFPLPANNGLRLRLLQAVFPSNRNGLVWVPGISENSCVGNTFTTAFITNTVQPTLQDLGQPVEGITNGEWRLGILSRKHLDDNPNDYAGAFADAVGSAVTPTVGSQRRRTTDRRGAPGAVV